jgi:GAF domain-containing protein
MTDSTVRRAEPVDSVRASDAAAVSDAPTETVPPFDPPLSANTSAVLPMLHEVLAALAHGEPRDETLTLLTEKARLLTDCASTAIALLDMDGETVSFLAASGQEAEELPGSRVRLADTVVGKTARTGEPYLAFRSTQPGGSLNNGSPGPQVSSAAVLPIFDDGKPIGAFAALNKNTGQGFDGTDYLALSTLASAASVVIGNARLRAEEQRQGRELSILYEAVRRVSGQLSGQEVLQAVVEQTAAHLENNGIVIFLANDERTHLYVAADTGLTEEQREVTLPTDTSVGAFLLSSITPLSVAFQDADEDLPLNPPQGVSLCPTLFTDHAARSGLLAPIRSGELIQGVVLVLSAQPPGSFTAADSNFLAALASQAAVGMENAWLYEDANRRAEEATALYELSQAASSTLNLNDVLERITESVLTLLSVDRFALFLHDRQTNALKLVISRGLSPGAEERLHPQIGEGIPGWVMEFETPTAVQDVAADHRNAAAPLHTEGVVSLMCMPLQVGAATIGVLAAMSSRRRLFTVAEMELLYTIANQAAVAIENARMYATTRQRSLEVRKYFHRIARALSSSSSPRNVPELIASLTLEVMEADRCALYSVTTDPDGEMRLEPTAAAGFRSASSADAIPAREDTPAGWIARHAHSLTVEYLPDDTRFAAFDRPLRGEVASYLGVPLRNGSRVVGVLEVYTRERRIWHADEVRLLLTFASQAAVAFRNARLARARERAERLNRLLERLLAMMTQKEAPTPEEVIAALALGFNTPVATLFREAGGDWELGPASVPADGVPLVALTSALREEVTETAEFQMASSPEGTAAVAVLAPSDAGALYSTRTVLETAAALLERYHAPGA